MLSSMAMGNPFMFITFILGGLIFIAVFLGLAFLFTAVLLFLIGLFLPAILFLVGIWQLTKGNYKVALILMGLSVVMWALVFARVVSF
jgi:hypothetical protein